MQFTWFLSIFTYDQLNFTPEIILTSNLSLKRSALFNSLSLFFFLSELAFAHLISNKNSSVCLLHFIHSALFVYCYYLVMHAHLCLWKIVICTKADILIQFYISCFVNLNFESILIFTDKNITAFNWGCFYLVISVDVCCLSWKSYYYL